MRFVSTRRSDIAASLSTAIEDGIAAEGGLYVPGHLPAMPADAFPDADALQLIATHLLRPFASGDRLEPHLEAICREAFNFPAPLAALAGTPGPASVLELFHGPTCAFKDFGARFLAGCLGQLHQGGRKVTILVATSGDTGGAVAAAFHNVPWADVVLLYPKGLVSPRQAQQLACWRGNVRTFAVLGTFDDCQRMVKEAFLDPALARTHQLSSANSINIGRLLPQLAYFASASLQIWRREARRPNFIIPAGNLGNATACVLAREMGLPIGDIVLATNENRTIVDYLESGTWEPRPSVATLASAMDVGNPSNMERLRWLWPDPVELRRWISAYVVSDEEIRSIIATDARSIGRVWCPHTATAAHLYRQVGSRRRNEHWVIVATAHPAKFSDIVEPLTGEAVPVPAALEKLLAMPRREQDLPPALEALRGQLQRPS
jgi:threonine synthase